MRLSGERGTSFIRGFVKQSHVEGPPCIVDILRALHGGEPRDPQIDQDAQIGYKSRQPGGADRRAVGSIVANNVTMSVNEWLVESGPLNWLV